MLLFEPDSVDSAASFEKLLTRDISHNNVGNLSTFLYPYDYSSVCGKSAYEKILSGLDPQTQCICACRFLFNAVVCGGG